MLITAAHPDKSLCVWHLQE
jgi:hypothetical protein